LIARGWKKNTAQTFNRLLGYERLWPTPFGYEKDPFYRRYRSAQERERKEVLGGQSTKGPSETIGQEVFTEQPQLQFPGTDGESDTAESDVPISQARGGDTAPVKARKGVPGGRSTKGRKPSDTIGQEVSTKPPQLQFPGIDDGMSAAESDVPILQVRDGDTPQVKTLIRRTMLQIHQIQEMRKQTVRPQPPKVTPPCDIIENPEYPFSDFKFEDLDDVANAAFYMEVKSLKAFQRRSRARTGSLTYAKYLAETQTRRDQWAKYQEELREYELKQAATKKWTDFGSALQPI
jgi:hypothetical protein